MPLYSSTVAESVEVLVKRSDMELDKQYSSSWQDPSPTCFGMFDCLSAKDHVREKRQSLAHKRASRRIGKDKLTVPQR